jgi:hypothetical protein
VLAVLVRKDDVVHNVTDEIVGVVVDRLSGAIITAGRWGRRLATVVVAVVDVPVVAVVVVPVVVIPAAVVPTALWGPALVPVAVAKIPSVPLRSPFLGPERVPGRARRRMIFGTRSGPSWGIGGTGTRRLLSSHLAGRLALGHGTGLRRAYML